MYVTSIHTLVSAITQLARISKVPSSRKVYRGLGGYALSDSFFNPDERNTKGGVDFSFISTSQDWDVAVQYSGGHKQRGVVMEISVGKIDSGAQLDKLSQYENEKEVLFPPLSNLEAVGDSRIETIGGDRILIVPIKINLNLKSKTIQERVESRKLQAVEMARKCVMEVKSEFARYNEDTQGEHTYDDCFLELQKLEAMMVEKDPEWFNYDNNFKECWNDVLLVKNRSMADQFGKQWMKDLQDEILPTLEFWGKLRTFAIGSRKISSEKSP